MAYPTLAVVKDNVSGILQGLNLDSVKNVDRAFERTARQVCVRLDIPEAVLKQAITIYDGVYDYLAPTNMFASAITDLRPQGNDRDVTSYAVKQPPDQFDREKAFTSTEFKTTVEYDKGTGIMRIASGLPTARIEIDPMTTTTGWTAGGSAGSLTADSTVFFRSPSSLRLTLTGASTGTLTKTTPSFDFTNYRNVGVAFLAIRTPSATDLTSIELRLGSDASNYYSVSATTGFIKSFTAGDWMLIAFDFSTATTIGSPTITAIDYTQLGITHGATLTNFYVGDLWISLPTPCNVFYQTSAIFLPSGSSTPINTITNDSDTIQLNDSALAIYELETAKTIARQQGGTLANGVVADINEELNGVRARNGLVVQLGLYDLYRADNPSQEIRSTGSYYEDSIY